MYRYSQVCGHVGAVLFCLSEMIACGLTEESDQPSCTEMLCKWTDPKGMHSEIIYPLASPWGQTPSPNWLISDPYKSCKSIEIIFLGWG